jgi:hypothetical protein
MRIIITVLILTFLTLTSSGQEMEVIKINSKDSVDLEVVWKQFAKGLLSKDTNGLRQLSLNLVDCSSCISRNTLPEDYFVPIDTFLFQAFHHLSDSKLLSVIRTKKYHFLTNRIPNYQPRSIKNRGGTDLTIYEVWYNTYEPNEWAKGHEGQSHCFEFVKVDERYKFYGLSSIP